MPKKKSLHESELEIQQTVREGLIPELIAKLKETLKISYRPKDISDVSKVIISLSGLDKQTNNVNLGNVVNFNMNEGTLKNAFGLIGKMANISQGEVETFIQEVDQLKVVPPNKIKPTNVKKVGKTKKELPNLIEEAYEFLEEQ